MAIPPRVSIIMPIYNVVAFVEEAVESARRQTFRDWELLVVDDGSTDGSAEKAQALADEKIRLIRTINQGVSAARNEGLKEARGEIVAFLDGDDRWRRDALARLVKSLDEHSAACLAYGEGVVMHEEGDVFGPEEKPLLARRPSGDVLKYLLAANFIVNAGAVAVRKKALEKAGRFSTQLRMAEDWELWVRLALEGPFAYIGGRPILEYRQRSGSASRALGRRLDESVRALDMAFSHEGVKARLSVSEWSGLKRLREGGVYALAGTECLKARLWSEGRTHFFQSLRRRPFHIREWILFVCAATHILPGAIERRLK